MKWLERNPLMAAITTGMDAVDAAGFENGRHYEQVDLGSRAAVVGLARHLRDNDSDVSFFAVKAAIDIAVANDKSPGEYVVYTGQDEHGDEVAHVYQRVD